MVTEWVIAPLAKRGSRHEAPYCMPPKIGPLKYLAEFLVISVDRWKPLQLRVTDILSLLQMTILASLGWTFFELKMRLLQPTSPFPHGPKLSMVLLLNTFVQTVVVSLQATNSLLT